MWIREEHQNNACGEDHDGVDKEKWKKSDQLPTVHGRRNRRLEEERKDPKDNDNWTSRIHGPHWQITLKSGGPQESQNFFTPHYLQVLHVGIGYPPSAKEAVDIPRLNKTVATTKSMTFFI
jgi:hypothetical protein